MNDHRATELDYLRQRKDELPTAAVQHGVQRFCLDGRRSGQATGEGTGCWVYADVVAGSATWRRLSDDNEVEV